MLQEVTDMLQQFLIGSTTAALLAMLQEVTDMLQQFLTGSTTAALLAMLQEVTDMLQQFLYMHVFSPDFSKAFDTMRHSTLLSKLAKQDIPGVAYNWIKDLLTDTPTVPGLLYRFRQWHIYWQTLYRDRLLVLPATYIV